MDQPFHADDGVPRTSPEAMPPAPASGDAAAPQPLAPPGMPAPDAAPAGAGSTAPVTTAADAASPAAPASPADPTSPAAPLEALGRAIPPATIDELWIFPPRRIGAGQSTVLVASVMDAPASADERRRIFTARFTLVRGTRVPELRQEMTEEGAAPAELVARVVDGVVRRLDDEPAPPRHARIGGDEQAWAELLATLRE